MTGGDEPDPHETFSSDGGKPYTYFPTRRLGPRGRFGAVYSGTDGAGNPVAVKEVQVRSDPARAASDWAQVDRELEVAVAASGRPGLLPILDHAHLDDRLLIVMPRAERSLRDAITAGLSSADAIAAIRQVAEALQQLAVPGIIHRDIKPGNVLWWNDRWHVADFGIARIEDVGTAAHTWAGTGTLEYRAPEIWRGERETALSDLYALGCLAVEALTGQLAFPGPDFRMQHEQVIPVLPPVVDPQVARVVLMLLAKEPELRPQDARQVLELLTPAVGLTDAHRVLQQRATAAERRAREDEALDGHRRRLEGLRDRARASLRQLWQNLGQEVRRAVPDANGTEDDGDHYLVVGDLRLAAVRVHGGEDDVPLLVAELMVHDGQGSDGAIVANLVAVVEDDVPRWRLVTWAANAIARPQMKLKSPPGQPTGLRSGLALDHWRRQGLKVPPLIPKTTDATPQALLDLVLSVLQPR